MATKAIYTKIDNAYYKVNQPLGNPSNICRMPKTHAQMMIEESTRQVNTSIWINTINPTTVKSNRESYIEMVNYLRTNLIEKIDTIQDHYMMVCDYSVLDDNGKIINHNIVTRALPTKDAVYPLGSDKDCELVYKQVKLLDTDVTCTVRQEYPFGIMRNASVSKYQLRINDIAIYQDFVYDSEDVHRSVDAQGSMTITEILKTMTKVYSTYDNGVTISAVEVPFIPKNISLKFHILLDNTIVVYDSHVIDEILAENDVLNGPDDGGDDGESDGGTEIEVIILNGGNATPEITDDSILG
jgi:hypothetical protein